MTAPQGEPQERGQVYYTEAPPPEFSYEEYLAAALLIQQWLAGMVAAIAAPYQALQLTRADWLGFLAALYPVVDDARRAQAELARQFYDAERAKHLGPVTVPRLPEVITLPDGTRVDISGGGSVDLWERLNINLAPYEPDWFEEAMDAVVLDFRRAQATDGAVVNVISQALKEAENGGRRTLLWAVDDDPKVKGWARVEGNENVGSCGFCAMLISRGPVYTYSPMNAGLNIDDSARAVEVFRQAQAQGNQIPADLMTKWHPNCDCKVVPVFNYANWPGRDQFIAMSNLWRDTMKQFEEENGRSPKQGSAKRDNEALNALRRRLERGDLPRNIRRPQAA